MVPPGLHEKTRRNEKSGPSRMCVGRYGKNKGKRAQLSMIPFKTRTHTHTAQKKQVLVVSLPSSTDQALIFIFDTGGTGDGGVVEIADR